MAIPPPPPLPPPPPPPPPPTPHPTFSYEKVDPDLFNHILIACRLLEEQRCIMAEMEACQLFCSSLLSHPPGSTVDASGLPGAIQDAWSAISDTDRIVAQESLLESSKKDPSLFQLSTGQTSLSAQTTAMSTTLERAVQLSATISNKRPLDATAFRKVVSRKEVSSEDLLSVFDERLRQLRDYHALHSSSRPNTMYTSSKRQRVGNPLADGYNLSSLFMDTTALFSMDEVMGKYLDVNLLHTSATSKLRDLFAGYTNFIDFLHLLSKGLSTGLEESLKLKDRRKYTKWLLQLQTYVEGFLARAHPMLDVAEVIKEPLTNFEKEWAETGGVAGWARKDAEKISKEGIDLTLYSTADDLLAKVNADAIKAELTRLGLKCGGAPTERSNRLWLTKDTPLDQLPAKLFAKGTNPMANTHTSVPDAKIGGERRIDIARTEAIISSLFDQFRPTLDATIRRAERRQTQTLKERELELLEDLQGSNNDKQTFKSGEDDESDDDTPIYNPKGVPLGWDGKPIPYWLFKLHGLNHFYQCEICGNERYRGRRNFEKHFAEAKHGYGMKCLGIPNTMHFHGVTNIEDAQQLWSKLQGTLEEDLFDGTKHEEYEDSLGNVLTRSTYEDLARQGLL